ncbi:Mur ligase [Radiomyces spectabilis]|uniref:Mur ligase n=1 Tax=Radiomyces spectabilis TaxID=64574 RepID=UPI002220F1FE|nr:Mur ligase [Radiomyces spectabilis]KAI8374580.1 Mur ligase [Radiomyces spectabilis]
MNDRSLPEFREYLKRIGYESKDFDSLNVIHVAGTKGKGSTCAFTQSILRHASSDRPIRTGLFTSPHLVAVRERIRINGEPISEDQFAKYSQDVWDRLEATKEEALAEMEAKDKDMKDMVKSGRQHPDKPVYFRYLTLVALHAFMQENVDVAILEVGVGGEYDSTNIVEKPIVCGITALGLDHVSVLGDTIDKIAWHKAGIIKPHVPVVSFEQLPEAIEVVKQRAQDNQAPLEIIHASQVNQLDGIKLGLAGLHQKYNALTAIAMCKIWLERCRQMSFSPEDAVPASFHKGLTEVKWPGRGQQLDMKDTKYAAQVSSPVKWYLDGAHTIESLQVCVDWFRENMQQDKSRVLVFNCTNGRDGPRLLKVMNDIQRQMPFDHVVFTTNVTYREGYTTDNTNKTVSMKDALAMQRMLRESWIEQNPSFNADHVHVASTIQDAVEWVVDHAKSVQKDVQVLTTGSLILVGNTLTVLGMPAQ